MDKYTYSACKNCHSINRVKIEKIESSKGLCGKCGKELSFHKFVSEVSDQELLNIVEKSDLPVVVDFWAPWCGPCRSFAPTFEAASEYSKGKVVFLKINTENFPQISSRFNIRGIPSLLVFKNGKEIARESGAFPLDYFNQWITKFY